MSAPFRLGFFCPQGLRSFSSIPHHIARTLSETPGIELVPMSANPGYWPPVWKRIVKRVERQFLGRDYLWEKAPARCRHISRQIDLGAVDQRLDGVLLFGSEGCAYCKTDVPLYCYADSLFGTRIGLYPDQSEGRLSPASLHEGVLVQQLGLDRLQRLFISSSWAVERAADRFGYRIPPGKVEVVRIGANLPHRPAPATDEPPVEAPMWLTWVGNFWKRKGGEFAVAVVVALREMGFDARLDIVGGVVTGCRETWIIPHGQLSYEDPVHFEALRDIYARSAALLLPSEGDLTPIAICEAFAFGRPVMVNSIGGIREMVADGRTGFLMEKSSPGVWAKRIAEAARSGLLWRMRPLCRQSYESGLSWEVVCARMLGAMRVPVGQHGERRNSLLGAV